MTGFTTALRQELGEIAETLQHSTVQVQEQRGSTGSGVIWHTDGLIITNAHVVRGRAAQVTLADGHELTATVTARDVPRDLVALTVQATHLPAVQVGNSDAARVGEVVVAVGNPLGQIGALTFGIIHSVSDPDHRHWIQTDLKLAPGNSGGGLATANGQVIGINTLISGGRGFAIPSRTVERFLQRVGESGRSRPPLGITVQPVRISGRSRHTGLLITAVEPDSLARDAGLQPGDIILGLRGKPFRHPGELFHTLSHSQLGDGLALWIRRGLQQITIDVVLWNNSSPAKTA